MGFVHGPAGQRGGHGVQVLDNAFSIGGNDAIANRLQGDLGALLFLEQRLLGALARRDVLYGQKNQLPLAGLFQDFSRVQQHRLVSDTREVVRNLDVADLVVR